jgi:hypothetical protein
MRTTLEGDCNRWHTVSIAFPVKVADATLVKQVVCYLCVSADIGTILERVFWKIKISPTCLWRELWDRLGWSKEFGYWK